MRIVKLEAENVKRLQAIEIHPDPSDPLVMIGGRNAQGKSSTLDALAWALGGKRLVQDKPVRDGEERARVGVDLGDLVVTWKCTAGGKPSLQVSTVDGACYSSPQAVLNKILGDISFDPLEFSRMRPRDRIQALLAVANIDLNLDQLAAKRQKLFDTRTQVGREIRQLEGAIAEIDLPPDMPEEEISITELANEVHAAHEKAYRRQAMADDIETIKTKRSAALSAMSDSKDVIERLKEQIRHHKTRIEKLKADVKKCDVEKAEAAEALRSAEKTAPDIKALEEQLAGAEGINAQVREAQRKAGLNGNRVAKEKERAKLTTRLKKLDQSKAKALAGADLPIKGLSLDDTDVTYNGIPFEQASSAEQLRVSLAIAMAANPKLRVILIRDGSLLDLDNLEMIREMAAGEDYQVWIERVGDGEEIGIVIEDGQVAEDRSEVAA